VLRTFCGQVLEMVNRMEALEMGKIQEEVVLLGELQLLFVLPQYTHSLLTRHLYKNTLFIHHHPVLEGYVPLR
jgi:hypothetical protein